MAKKQTDVRPLFAVKGEFDDTWKRFSNDFMMLFQAVETALQLDLIKDPIKPKMAECAENIRRTCFRDE